MPRRRLIMHTVVVTLVAAASPAAAQATAQHLATLRAMMAKPRVAATRHTAAELLTRYRSTAAGAASLAAAHKIATSGTTAGMAAAGRTSGGSGSGVTQSSQPGGTSGTASGSASPGSAALDITIDPTKALSGSATAGETTIQAALYFAEASGGIVLGFPASYYLDATTGATGTEALLSTSTLAPGWYIVTFDLTGLSGSISGSLWQQPMTGGQPAMAADCSASVLAQTDSRGVSTCMALVQITQAGGYYFAFALKTGTAAVVDAAISRVNP